MTREEVRRKIDEFLRKKHLKPEAIQESDRVAQFGSKFVPFCAITFKVGTMEESWYPEITLGEVIDIIVRKTGSWALIFFEKKPPVVDEQEDFFVGWLLGANGRD